MTDLARTPKHIGTLIRRTRKKLGLSQTELGDKAGFRQETILTVLAAVHLPRRPDEEARGSE